MLTSIFVQGAPWCFHLHEPVVHGDLDVCRVRLHRGQHRAFPGQQVERSSKSFPVQTASHNSTTVHNVLFVQYVFLPTEQSETYFKIFLLTYDLTYICPGLFDWKENTFF